jgi:transcription elongation factor Elf1
MSHTPTAAARSTAHVDGNALAGALALAFGTDMTTATVQCGDCGDRHQMAATHVYLRCPGMVMRCPACGTTEIVLTEIRGRIGLHVRRVTAISFA